MDRLIVLGLFVAGIYWWLGDDSEERYDSGYGDGYAEGYNTQCQIRPTLVAGDWEDKDYSKGYTEGRRRGVMDCEATRRK